MLISQVQIYVSRGERSALIQVVLLVGFRFLLLCSGPGPDESHSKRILRKTAVIILMGKSGKACAFACVCFKTVFCYTHLKSFLGKGVLVCRKPACMILKQNKIKWRQAYGSQIPLSVCLFPLPERIVT